MKCCKNTVTQYILIAFLVLSISAGSFAETVLVEAEGFDNIGGWSVDQQFMDQMGSPYLLAHGLGKPVVDARTNVEFSKTGQYRVWVRTRNWVAPWKVPGAPGKFQVVIDGKELKTVFGTKGAKWHWQDGGEVWIQKKQVNIALHDLTGFEGRCDAVLFSTDSRLVPPNEGEEMARFRRKLLGLPNKPVNAGKYDLVVVGGGMAGICTSVSAARLGLQVALIQDRPVLGGNNSSEVRVWLNGEIKFEPYPKIGDIVAELDPKIRAHYGPENVASIYEDDNKETVVRAEKNIKLFLMHRANDVEVKGNRIKAVIAQDIKSGRRLRFEGKWFADCTGDGCIGFLSGADHDMTVKGHMGRSNLWNVVDTGRPSPFPRCKWALDIEGKPFPGVGDNLGVYGKKGLEALGSWFWESGFFYDPIEKSEYIRDLNLRAMYGVWDTLKNSEKLYPNHKIKWAAYISGKRESRRILGDIILTTNDLLTGRKYEDGCVPTSWDIDVHLPLARYVNDFGLDAVISYDYHTAYDRPYWVPYRCLYSRNIDNLFMAGRDISVTHEALGSVRVMRTTGMMGEVVGMAASLCKKYRTDPRGVYKNHLKELKKLMKQGVGKSRIHPLTVSGKTVNTVDDYPYQPVPFTKVKFTDSFWLPRMEINRAKTIPFAFKMCEDTHRIENFKVAGGLSDKKWQGQFGFNDSDVFKVMEGASYALMVKEDTELDNYLDELITFIAAAQEDSGYLYTAWTARARDHLKNIWCCYHKEPWDDLRSAHELYNVGHMYEAAAAHYLATGKKNFLNVATKNADHICELFGPGKNEGVPGHQEIEIGLVKLYRVTGDDKYLKQAKWFLDQRGRGKGKGDAYNQQHIPVTDQKEAVGHAVRANYMYSGMADVAALTGDKDFIKAIDTLWDNVTNKKLYITGGIGARHKGESYGDNYELPNASAYCETCSAIANVYWNHRMFLLHGKSKYIDVMERSLYNNVLSGVSLDGMKFFYPNPLESDGKYKFNHGSATRQEWFGCACCPSNICRFMASMPGYVYAIRDNELYVNLFVDSQASFDVKGKPVTLMQKTRYPWDGRIEITVSPEAKKQSFVINIRIPDWAHNRARSSLLYKKVKPVKEPVTVTVNGKKVSTKLKNGFAAVKREWKKGDKIVINLPMPAQRILCDQRAKDNIGKTAIQRGPIIYCIEWPDVEEGKVLNLMLEKDTKLSAEHKKELLGGVTVVKGAAKELRRSKEGRGLEWKLRKFSAIPYYAWSHREKGPMAVWLPFNEKYATPLPPETIAPESNTF